MKHYLYKITNTLNSKYYIGIHSCDGCFFDSNYYGSGVAIKHAINKYGLENFKREVIDTFQSREEVVKAEELMIGEELVKSDDCYNLVVGGGNPPIGMKKGCKLSEESKENIRRALTGRKASEEARANQRKAYTQERKDYMSKIMKGRTSPMKGAKRTESSLENARKALRKPVMVDGVLYSSMREAAEALGIPKTTLRNRVHNTRAKWSEYYEVNTKFN